MDFEWKYGEFFENCKSSVENRGVVNGSRRKCSHIVHRFVVPFFFVFKELTQIHVRASVRVHNSKQHTNEQTMQSFKVEMLVNDFRMQARTSIVLLTHTFVS